MGVPAVKPVGGGARGAVTVVGRDGESLPHCVRAATTKAMELVSFHGVHPGERVAQLTALGSGIIRDS